MSEDLAAEFDTVAAWTADAAIRLGPDHYLPAGCRGSGSPAALDWLIARLHLSDADRMLDCGAGVGGPAAYAADQVGVRPVLTDPEHGACRAASRLFDLPVAQAGSQLPFGAAAFDVAWCLGVLCTVSDQAEVLNELSRVLRPSGRLGLLVFVADGQVTGAPEGNNFPAAVTLRRLLTKAGFRISETVPAATFGPAPRDWQQRADAVDAEMDRAHSGDPIWSTAVDQSVRIGEVIDSGQVVGTVLVATKG